MNERRKKIPIIRYLCYLLAVSILFTGVTFSRYVSFTSGNTDAMLSRFAVSYEIGDMSALTFSNADYWLNFGGAQVAMNTARTVRFTVRNHTRTDNGVPLREILTMSGGFEGTEADHSGTIRAYSAQTKSEITLTAALSRASYSVGFYRSDAEDESKSASQFFLDCEKEIPFYTLDISLPDLLFKADGSAQERTFVLFLTVIERSAGEEYSMEWTDEFLKQKSLNGATVTGYHFDRDASVFEEGADGRVLQSRGQRIAGQRRNADRFGRRLRERAAKVRISPFGQAAPMCAFMAERTSVRAEIHRSAEIIRSGA